MQDPGGQEKRKFSTVDKKDEIVINQKLKIYGVPAYKFILKIF